MVKKEGELQLAVGGKLLEPGLECFYGPKRVREGREAFSLKSPVQRVSWINWR